MEGITAITYCNNEEENIPGLFKSLKGVDEKILIDHLSTDKTSQIAKKLGFTVIRQGNVIDTVVQEDVDEFEARYGFKPIFTVGNTVPHWPKELNALRKLAHNDWILWIDADERLVWDEKEIRKLLPDNDVITCVLDNGSEPFTCVEFARKSKTWWECRIHSALVGHNVRVKNTDKMKLMHYQRPRDYRAGYLPTLEFAMVREGDLRTNYYLSREYYNYQEFDKSIQFFSMYLKSAFDPTEISFAYTCMAICYWKKGMEEEAFSCVHSALRVDPSDKKALLLMTEMVRPSHALIWKKYIASL